MHGIKFWWSGKKSDQISCKAESSTWTDSAGVSLTWEWKVKLHLQTKPSSFLAICISKRTENSSYLIIIVFFILNVDPFLLEGEKPTSKLNTAPCRYGLLLVSEIKCTQIQPLLFFYGFNLEVKGFLAQARCILLKKIVTYPLKAFNHLI